MPIVHNTSNKVQAVTYSNLITLFHGSLAPDTIHCSFKFLHDQESGPLKSKILHVLEKSGLKDNFSPCKILNCNHSNYEKFSRFLFNPQSNILFSNLLFPNSKVFPL